MSSIDVEDSVDYTDLEDFQLELDRGTSKLYPALAKTSLDNHIIAGQGEKGEDCGNWIPDSFCEDCGKPVLAERECNKRTCPNCWENWRAKQVRSAFKRLVGYDLFHWKAKNQGASNEAYEDLEEFRFVHSVVSFKDLDSDESYEDVRERAKDLCKEAGYVGFILVPHHYRLDDDIKDELRAEGYNNEGGFWKAVIDDELDLGGWCEYVVAGLHFHVIGFSGRRWSGDERLEEGQDVGLESDLFRRVRDLRGVEDVKRVLMYVSTHATPESTESGSKHWSSYSGELAYNKFSTEWSDKLDKSLTSTENSYLDKLFNRSFDEDLEDEREECDNCGCSRFLDIWKANEYLKHVSDVEFRDELERAFELAIGEVKDPPDLSSKEAVKSYLENGK